MNRIRNLVCVIFVLAVASFAIGTWAQDSSVGDPNALPRRGLNVVRPMEPTRPVGLTGRLGHDREPDFGVPMRVRIVTETNQVQRAIEEPIPPEELEAEKEFQEALKNLKEAKDDDARQSVSKTIRKHLTNQYEQDLKQREQELTAVEARVKSLRQQLDKRQAAKDDVISLRLKSVINNAEGLGFPGDEESGLSYSTPTTGVPRARRPLAKVSSDFNPTRRGADEGDRTIIPQNQKDERR